MVEVKGEELDEISAISGEVMERITGIPGIYNIRSSVEDGAPEVTISVDRTVAGIHNVSVSDCYRTVEAAARRSRIRQDGIPGRNAGYPDQGSRYHLA